MANTNRVPAGVPTGGEFATGTRAENADLAVGPLTREQAAELEALQDRLADLGNDASDRLIEMNAGRVKLMDQEALAIVADAAISARVQHGTKAAFLRLVDWEEDGDEDGSYGVNIAAVCDANGRDIEELGQTGFTSPGRHESPTWHQGVPDGKPNLVNIDSLINSAKQARHCTPARPSLEQMRAEMNLLDGIQNEHICEPRGDARIVLGNQPVLGKGIWTSDGKPAPEGTDPRDAYVKVASSKLFVENNGRPGFVSFATLAEYRAKGELPYYIEVGH